MRYLRNFLVLSAVVLGVSAFSANAQAPQSPLERQVFKEIVTLPYYGVFDHISYQVEGSTVTLSGKVWSLGTKRDAESEVRRIPGVDRVVNNIVQLPPSGFDDSIRQRVVNSFLRDGGSLYRYLQGPNPSMRIIVENGNISLEGYVSNNGDKTLANIIANGIPGVFKVNNNLIVERGK